MADEDQEQLIARAHKCLATIRENVEDLTMTLMALQTPKAKRTAKQTDKNGEPTWAYATRREIPEDFHLTKRLREYAEGQGFKGKFADELFEDFTSYYRRSKKKWADWSRTWFDWCRRQKKRAGTDAALRTSRSMPEL